VVNVLGSFIIGLTVAHNRTVAPYLRAGTVSNLQALVAIGFAGAFTTWSTFTLDLYLAFELKQYKKAATNLVFSISLGLIAVELGMRLVQ
jgi:CrcB protein